MNSFEEGQVILINKPLGWTSADVVKKITKPGARKSGACGYAGSPCHRAAHPLYGKIYKEDQ